MRKLCVQCGQPFDAVRSHAKFCSPRCRKASARGTPPSTLKVRALDGPEGQGEGVVAAVRAELVAAGRDGTVLGASAVALAARMDASTAVMGYAALVRELRATMAAALAGAVAADAVDEVKARRDRKLLAAG